MKTSPSNFSLLRGMAPVVLACSLAVLTVTSCSSISGTGETTILETPEGVTIVDTFQATATVTAVNPNNRKITLRMSDGKRKTVKAGPEVVNFNQIEVNDRVTLSITEEYAVFLGRGASPSATGAAAVAIAPVGAKPGTVMTSAVKITARVSAVDPAKRKVILELPDGSMKTVKAGKQVDLSGLRPGDNITVDYTETIAIAVGNG